MGKLRILGSGTSTGVPEIGCTCPVCTSTDPRDNRLRASSLLHTDDAVILIDCGPDFREQMLRASSFEKIDGVLVTHEHYDHVGGLDDLRPFGRFADIPIYSDAYTAAHLRARMPYCFVDKVYPGVPRIYLQEVEAGQVFHINRTEVLPLRVMHGRLPILGYRIGGRLGYITDMHMMPEESYEQLKGLDVYTENEQHDMPIEKKFDWGLCGGPGIELRTGIGSFLLEGRYYYALSDIFNSRKEDYFSKSSSQVISAKITYMIPGF